MQTACEMEAEAVIELFADNPISSLSWTRRFESFHVLAYEGTPCAKSMKATIFDKLYCIHVVKYLHGQELENFQKS